MEQILHSFTSTSWAVRMLVWSISRLPNPSIATSPELPPDASVLTVSPDIPLPASSVTLPPFPESPSSETANEFRRELLPEIVPLLALK
ncbi:hypothetical protein QUB00_24455 [Microcoleus sp. F8_C2]